MKEIEDLDSRKYEEQHFCWWKDMPEVNMGRCKLRGNFIHAWKYVIFGFFRNSLLCFLRSLYNNEDDWHIKNSCLLALRRGTGLI